MSVPKVSFPASTRFETVFPRLVKLQKKAEEYAKKFFDSETEFPRLEQEALNSNGLDEVVHLFQLELLFTPSCDRNKAI
jgi:hypothetical protein